MRILALETSGMSGSAAALEVGKPPIVVPFERTPSGHWQRTSDTHLIAIDQWLAALREGDTVTGPVITKNAARLPPGVLVAPPDLREPNAGVVAELAAEQHAAGRRDDLWTL